MLHMYITSNYVMNYDCLMPMRSKDKKRLQQKSSST